MIEVLETAKVTYNAKQSTPFTAQYKQGITRKESSASINEEYCDRQEGESGWIRFIFSW